ncbi:MAG: D-glycerate dehydrogenase, partial [Proteobacteria bacterium]|nr:D-glycerate dehydrogenase [Pseudomonadota bacterium]
MSRPKIFITQPIEESALKRLQAVMDVEVHPDATKPISQEDLIRGIRNKDFLFCRLHDTIGAEALEANPNLKLIATMATSTGQIDMKTATRLKIPVTGREIPVEGVHRDSIIEETADMAWTLLMAVARRLVEGNEMAHAGNFPGSQSMYLVGSQVQGQTLGIVGMGKVGRAMARRAKGFRMKVLFFDKFPLPEVEQELGATQTTLEDLLRESDFVTLHPIYTPETHHLISARELSLMKPTAFLINASRGKIIDQDALVEAMRAKRIAGVALDVFR